MATTPGSAPKKRKVGDAIADAVHAARAELEEREAKVEEREEALRKALEGVDNEKRLMAGCTPNDVLPLNIGGTKCHVQRKTLNTTRRFNARRTLRVAGMTTSIRMLMASSLSISLGADDAAY